MDAILILVVLGLVAVVVAALVAVFWHERRSAHDSSVALVAGSVLTLWAVVATLLAYRGVFQIQDVAGAPAVGINLVVVWAMLAAGLIFSASLRGLLTRQTSLIRLHLWRLVGLVFLALMMRGQLPALFAVPAGLGDILIAMTAPWVARTLDARGGRRRALIWNLLGMADLVVAVGLGIMTSPGPANVFHTTPTSEVMTTFPMVLVPAFLVPLAFTLHVVSLWQLRFGAWRRETGAQRLSVRGGAAGAPASVHR
jgi:hypothetical protein